MGKESAFSAGDPGLIPGSGRSPGEGNSYQLQYSCLENSMDRGAWWATASGVAKSDMTEQLTLSLFFHLNLRGKISHSGIPSEIARCFVPLFSTKKRHIHTHTETGK